MKYMIGPIMGCTLAGVLLIAESRPFHDVAIDVGFGMVTSTLSVGTSALTHMRTCALVTDCTSAPTHIRTDPES